MNPEFDDLELNYVRWLPSDAGASVLDIGCGPGRVLAFLAARGYRNLEGLDRDPAAVALARARVSARIEVADDWARFLAGRDSAFDVVVLKDVIYYLPRERVVDALKTVKRALKPGGRVLVEVFNGAAFTGPFVAFKDEAILWTPTEHTIRAFLERAGFVNVSVGPQVPPARGLKRRLFNAVASAWRVVLQGIYLIERGLSEGNPKILTTKIIAAGEAPA